MARRRPTDRQIEALAALPPADLFEQAVDALFALNRRAKIKRDQRNKYRGATFAESITGDIATIYRLKTRCLDALVARHLALVERFDTPARYSTDGELERWYLVRTGAHSFHVPADHATKPIRAAAQPGTAHHPYQQARPIPDVGLTIEAQHRAVKLLIEQLIGMDDSELAAVRARECSLRQSHEQAEAQKEAAKREAQERLRHQREQVWEAMSRLGADVSRLRGRERGYVAVDRVLRAVDDLARGMDVSDRQNLLPGGVPLMDVLRELDAV